MGSSEVLLKAHMLDNLVMPIAAWILITYLVYLCGLTINRLYFSPLAKFPGSKLAAATGWYETYYQLVRGGGGQFTFKIKEWHDEYGPIVRINPYEIHIHDPDYYETLYSMSETIDKPSYTKYQFSAPGATFSTVEHELHRQRKAAVSPFFSKRKILERAPSIQSHVEKICRRLTDEYAGTGKVLNVNDLFSSYTGDVITEYAFDRSYGFLDKADFISPFTTSISSFKKFSHYAIQFPWIPRLLAALPVSVLMIVQPSMLPAFEYKLAMKTQIQDILSGIAVGKNNRLHGTIFSELMQSNLPSQELSVDRLMDEAAGVVGAGIETTKWATVVTFFHILNVPNVLNRLRIELERAIPNHNSTPSLSELEKLPWLMACIEEGLRLSYGSLARSPRIFRDKPQQYQSWIIPPGVPISSDSWEMHHDENIYPDSFAYRPERWLNNPKGPDARKNLSRYMTSFGKGTRMCLGLQLGYAEMVLVLSALFRRFEFGFFETGTIDVDCYFDQIAPGVHPKSKGVRVVVKGLG